VPQYDAVLYRRASSKTTDDTQPWILRRTAAHMREMVPIIYKITYKVCLCFIRAYSLRGIRCYTSFTMSLLHCDVVTKASLILLSLTERRRTWFSLSMPIRGVDGDLMHEMQFIGTSLLLSVSRYLPAIRLLEDPMRTNGSVTETLTQAHVPCV